MSDSSSMTTDSDVTLVDSVTAARREQANLVDPILILDKNTTALSATLDTLLGPNAAYHVSAFNAFETCIKFYDFESRHKAAVLFKQQGRHFYIHHSKGLEVIIRGLNENIKEDMVKDALDLAGFKIRTVTVLKTKKQQKAPAFRVELMPENLYRHGGRAHPIYFIQYLFNQKITIRQAEKDEMSSPMRCNYCQELGHTVPNCNTRIEDYARLNPPVVCSNCGGPHLTNHPGCPVYVDRVWRQYLQRQEATAAAAANSSYSNNTQQNQNFAEAFKQTNPQFPHWNNYNHNVPVQPNLEAMIVNLAQGMTQCMVSMHSMLQEILKAKVEVMQYLMKK